MVNGSKADKAGVRQVKAAAGAVRARFGRGRAVIVADLVFALATLAILFGLFMAWQSWLIFGQAGTAQQLATERQDVVREMTLLVDDQRMHVAAELAAPTVLVDLNNQDDPAVRATVAEHIKSALDGAQAVTLYSPQLNEVLRGNLRQLGYARAAQLMSTMSLGKLGPAESPRSHVLSYAGPIVSPAGKVLAYATVDYHDAPLRVALHSARVRSGRLVLKQSNKVGDVVLDSVGDPGLTVDDDDGVPIPNSLFAIAAAPPAYWLPVTGSLAGAAALAFVGLFGGLLLFWWRPRLRERLGGAPATNEPVFAEILAQGAKGAAAPAAAAAKPAAVAAPEAAPAAVAAAESETVPDASIFRAYDIRGVVGKTLNESVARQLGRAIGSLVRERELAQIVVGRDGRESGPKLAGALIDGLRSTGVDVIDIGAVPTPVSYFAAYHLNAGSCVSVTGSHNPPDYNGFKIVVGGETLAEQAIQDIYQRILDGHYAQGTGTVRSYDILPEYIERIASDIQTGHGLKVVVDCGNGIAGNVAPGVVHAIGCEPIPLYCDVDGTFPNHHPDPSEPKNLADLILTVKQTGADLGLAFDGDGDRLGVVTKDGEIIYPDRVLMLYAQDVLTRNPGATIVYDVKCTGHLQPLILAAGGSPLMWKTGHSLIKAKMKETGAQLAGEMSGHFFFRERWYGFDDGIYAAARLLEILADDPEGRTPEEIFATLPKGVSTPELHIQMAEGQAHPFIARFRERAQFDGARITTIDGVRADWPDGFGLVRASNTTPVLVLRFDANDAGGLQRIEEAFRTQLLACDSTLELPF